MPETGLTISHYRITEKLGQRGMGEVYRAHNTALDRQGAIEVLPDIFSSEPKRLAFRSRLGTRSKLIVKVSEKPRLWRNARLIRRSGGHQWH